MPRPRPFWGAATLAALAVITLGSLSGCIAERPTKTVIYYSEDARKAYEKGLDAFNSKNWLAVEELMGNVKRKYAYSRYARLAELRLADARYRQDRYAEAIAGYKSYVHDHPNDPEVPYARFQVAKSQFDSISQAILLPPAEERDLAAVNDAISTLQQLIRDYPGSPRAAELNYMLEVVTGLLARHELFVARFYLNKGKYKAAVQRVEYALDKLENSGLEPEALLLLGEIHLQEHERDKARAALTRLLKDYPASPFAVAGRNYLNWLGSAHAPKTPGTTLPSKG